jgi:hypothetical protein
MDDVQEKSLLNHSNDGVHGNDLGNQATLPVPSNGADNDNTMLFDNDDYDILCSKERCYQ